MDYFSMAFLTAVLQIIAIDILLGGDNAVVIALACRKLPEQQRNKGIAWGVAGAIILRVILIFFALQLLALPFLKIVGALLLLWIGVKLLQPEEDDAHANVQGATTLLGAIKTIVIADAVMSLDNVIAVAGAAKGEMGLVVFGILISIPIIVWGSKLVLKLMDRFPMVITFGAALLGWIAGDMFVSDAWIKPYLTQAPTWLHYITAAAGAILVVLIGKFLAGRAAPAAAPSLAQQVNTKTKILVPIDGSAYAQQALSAVLKRTPLDALDIQLINIQMPVESGHARMFVDHAELENYYQAEGLAALAAARQELAAKHLPDAYQIKVGHASEQICAVAAAQHFDEIVMATHGRTGLLKVLMGSVAKAVSEESSVRVTLITAEPSQPITPTA